MPHDQALKTISVMRRWYGMRYSSLPIDTLDRRGFTIDCTESYMRPHMYDLLPGDIVRWTQEGETYQASIATVEWDDTTLYVSLNDAFLIPELYYPYW